MTLTVVNPWASAGPGFNHTAADTVYKMMTTMDEDTALIYGRILVADSIHYDLIAHRDEVAKVAGDLAAKHARVLREHYTRTAVSKARAGQDNTHEIRCLVQIGKAFSGFTTQQRQHWASEQPRGAGGRFVQDHTRISTNDARPPMNQKEAARVGGIPEANLKGADLAHYQQAYGQIQDMLAPFHNQNLGAMLHLRIAERGGEMRDAQIVVGRKADLPELKEKLKDGDRIETASVSVQPPSLRDGGNPPASAATLDALAAAGMPRIGGYAADAYGGVLGIKPLREYNEARLKVGDNEPFSGASRAFGRLERGSSILQDSLGPVAPPKLQYALAVANHVGQYGPEAQKVIGPAADRAAYRYRGTEKTPDRGLQQVVGRYHARNPEGAHSAVVEGFEGGPGEEWNPGPVLRYFHGRLPNPDLNELQRRSGVIPPSEGIIIGANGAVAHQSVGFADDWYLPFNLRHLTALKGGEYIRTRSFGGPTTEDVYTGLVSGAKSLTVVSHAGTYTVDFDRNLRGGRRFNDKAAQMVARYGQLLDAVRSEQVSRGGISPGRMAELRTSARDFAGDDSSNDYRERLAILQNDERRTPTLSRQESSDAADNWLGTLAARQTTNDGRTMTSTELEDRIVDTEAKKRLRADKENLATYGAQQQITLDQFKGQVRGELGGDTPTAHIRAVAALIGQTDQFDRAMRTASDENARRVRSLKLNGDGYRDALMALQEQFPYYIANVAYHPWRGSAGIGAGPTHEGTKDTGYVAPKFNRPADAEAGYFNPDVTGRGKVKAQSTRYQNIRVGQGKLVPVKERGVAPRSDAAAPAPADAPAAGGDELLRAANAKMLDEVLANQKFDAGAKMSVNGVPLDYSGGDIRTEVAHPQFPNAAMKRVFTTPPRELEAQTTPDELSRLLLDIAGLTQGQGKVFATLPSERLVRNRGKAAVPLPTPSSPGQMLREVGEEHSFPGIAYDNARSATPEQVERAYEDEPIKSLVAAGDLLPVNHPDSKEFDGKATALQARLKTAEAQNESLQSQGGRPDPVAARKDARAAEGLLRATQLRRRWVEADANRPKPVEPPAPTSTTTYQVVATPDVLATLQEQMNAAAANPDARHVISGS